MTEQTRALIVREIRRHLRAHNAPPLKCRISQAFSATDGLVDYKISDVNGESIGWAKVLDNRSVTLDLYQYPTSTVATLD